jgi:hypothetical protein
MWDSGFQVTNFRSDMTSYASPLYLEGRHHDSLSGELAELVHGLASEDFQEFYHGTLPAYVGSAASLPGLDQQQRAALLELLPASACDEPSMKRGLGGAVLGSGRRTLLTKRTSPGEREKCQMRNDGDGVQGVGVLKEMIGHLRCVSSYIL